MNADTEPGEVTLRDPQGASAVGRLAELATELGADDIARTAHSLACRVLEGRFYVACVGQFKRGKSTVLNALVGHSVLPAGVLPVTAAPTIIRYGQCLAARVRFHNAEWTEIPVSAVGEFVSEEWNPGNARGVDGLEIFVPSALLAQGMCLVDTPGLGSVHVRNSAATRAFVPQIDAAIVVIGADPPLSGEELDLVDVVAAKVRELFFVLNKADRVNESDRAEATQFARKILGARLGRPIPAILEVSALERLEGRGMARDWPQLVAALEGLAAHSGRSLVQKAAERGLRRAADQLLAVIAEERDALQRPLHDSEQRIAALRIKLEDAERAMRELGYSFTAEQQRLSEMFAVQRTNFLKQAAAGAHEQLAKRLREVRHRRSGPRYRRDVMHAAQEVTQVELMPWLERETECAEHEFEKTARRFAAQANDFLQRFAESGIAGVNDLPDEMETEQGLRGRSQFRFHSIERVAAPASPFRYVADIVLGVLGVRGPVVRDAHAFLDHLLEVNSARVQNDVDERIRQSRGELESEIKSLLGRGMATAERALERARVAYAAGRAAIEAALVRLDALNQRLLRYRG